VFVEGGLYHVYNRFARGAEIFRIGDEPERFLDLIREARDRDGLAILAWCLMSNHYHLAVRAGAVPLARTMGFVQARFGQAHNRRWRSSGPLWQSRYKAKLVEGDGYVRQFIAYIHLNPVAAGLVSAPREYNLSGHGEILGTSDRRLVDVDEVLSLFGEGVRAARRAYRNEIEGVHTAMWRDALPGRLPWWGAEPDRPVRPSPGRRRLDPSGTSTGRDRPTHPADVFVVRSCEVIGVERAVLLGGGASREVSHARYLIAALAVERWRVRTADLARVFDRRGDVMSRWVRLGVELRRTDDAFARAFENLDATLATARPRKALRD
jgi:REP element-mobilizing transposase RayT